VEADFNLISTRLSSRRTKLLAATGKIRMALSDPDQNDRYGYSVSIQQWRHEGLWIG
jgi:hypothetical protein